MISHSASDVLSRLGSQLDIAQLSKLCCSSAAAYRCRTCRQRSLGLMRKGSSSRCISGLSTWCLLLNMRSVSGSASSSHAFACIREELVCNPIEIQSPCIAATALLSSSEEPVAETASGRSFAICAPDNEISGSTRKSMKIC